MGSWDERGSCRWRYRLREKTVLGVQLVLIPCSSETVDKSAGFVDIHLFIPSEPTDWSQSWRWATGDLALSHDSTAS